LTELTPDSESHTVKELEQEKIVLEEINQFLELEKTQNQEILDSMSHEFRTPLVIIKSYIDMISQGKFGSINSTQREKLELVQTNVSLLITAILKTLDNLENVKK